jgi:small GTP-binding protein
MESKKIPQKPQAQDNTTTPPIKIVFLGDGNCGKTSALISYTTDIFNSDYTPTVFDTYESTVKKGDHMVKLELWDTAGQDEYKKLRSLSYPKTDVFLICFSMVEKKSFMNAIGKWHNEVK